jgi:5-carboxymethyl-2-hydroxymuconate isomerase
MPHLILECSPNLWPPQQAATVLADVHTLLCSQESVQPQAVKSRIVQAACAQVGTANPPFVHMELRLLVGRAVELRQTIAQSLYQRLVALAPPGAAVTLELREMDAATYQK